MATNADDPHGTAHLDGIDYDCRLALLEAVTKIDSATAPQLGENVRIVITGRITDSGQKVTADTPHPYLKATVDTMAISRA